MENNRTTVPLNQLKQAPVCSQRLKQQTQDLHGSVQGPLHMYYSFQFNILWVSWVCEWMGLWFFCLFFSSFSAVCLPCLTSMWFFYLIILLNCIFVIFCCHFLETCCFLTADKRGGNLREIDMERNKEE